MRTTLWDAIAMWYKTVFQARILLWVGVTQCFTHQVVVSQVSLGCGLSAAYRVFSKAFHKT